MAPQKPLAPAPAPAPSATAMPPPPPLEATPATSITLTAETLEDLENRRDAFVTAMTTLSFAAQTAARTGFDYFKVLAEASGQSSEASFNAATALGASFNAHVARAQSLAPTDMFSRGEGEEHGEGKKQKRKRTVKEKDPNEPKKPLSAYMSFLNEARKVIQAEGGHFKGKEITTEAAVRWKALSPAEKTIWEDSHRSQLAEWQKKMEIYIASKGGNPTATTAAVTASSNHAEAPRTFKSVNAPESSDDAEEEEEDEPEEEEEEEEEEEAPPPPSKRAKSTPKSNGVKAVPEPAAAVAQPDTPTQAAKGKGAKAAAAAAAVSTPAQQEAVVQTPETSKRKRGAAPAKKRESASAVKEKESSKKDKEKEREKETQIAEKENQKEKEKEKETPQQPAKKERKKRKGKNDV